MHMLTKNMAKKLHKKYQIVSTRYFNTVIENWYNKIWSR